MDGSYVLTVKQPRKLIYVFFDKKKKKVKALTVHVLEEKN